MPRRWTEEEEIEKYTELYDLYIVQNLTIKQCGRSLGVTPQTIFSRLQRVGIPPCPSQKSSYAARLRGDMRIPDSYTPELAEFFGIMLGDGHLSYYQVMVTLGNKENSYVQYVAIFMKTLFGIQGSISYNSHGYATVYVGSRELVKWLLSEGLIGNKVEHQVGIPSWIYKTPEYMVRFLRGFFDTDGSVYRLRFGLQISITNYSLPLLDGSRDLLIQLGYHPSRRSGYHIYLTRREEVSRFFADIRPANEKHTTRFTLFCEQLRAGRIEANYSTL